VVCEQEVSPAAPRCAARIGPTTLAQALLVTWVTPGGRGSAAMTEKSTWTVCPGARLERVRVQGDAAAGAAHDQPGELAAASKEVLAGTVSWTTTSEAT
jgi:hypothetical protein